MKAQAQAVTLLDRTVIPILHEDRAVLALDKPEGWILGPDDRDHRSNNLQSALEACIAKGPFWVRSRNLRYLRFVHRLDAGTSGILLFAKSQGAVWTMSRLFAGRQVKKTYLAVVSGVPTRDSWACKSPLGPDPARPGFHRVDTASGKPAETHFEVLAREGVTALICAHPITGRTHQIRLHLKEAGFPVLGDDRYGSTEPTSSKSKTKTALALRAIELEYRDPFTRRLVTIRAPAADFLKRYHFSSRPNEGFHPT